jgi:hypothetical protein
VGGTSAADAEVGVIADDNRLPTVSTKYKIRLIHAAPSLAAQTLTMKVASSDVGDSQPFRGASDFEDLNPTGDVIIDITTPADGTIVSAEKTPLSKGVYTVFVRDSSAGVAIEFKQER